MNVHRVTRDMLRESCELEIAGSMCVVRTNSGELARRLAVSWPIASSEPAVGFAVQVEVEDRRTKRDAAPPHFRGMRQFVFATFHNADVFVFDILRREISAVVSQQTAADERFWNRVFIPIALGIMGPSIGAAPMHCAALSWGDQGVLIAGDSGAGKSTLSFAMAQRGFEFISDDWTYVRKIRGGELIGYGLRLPAKLLPDSAEFFPELRALQLKSSMNGEIAYEVEADSLLRAEVREKCAVTKLVMLKRVAGTCGTLERIEASRVRDHFANSVEKLPIEVHAATLVRASVIDAISERECWQLEYGGAPSAGAEILSRFLEAQR